LEFLASETPGRKILWNSRSQKSKHEKFFGIPGLTTGAEVQGIGLELQTSLEYVHEEEDSEIAEEETSISIGFTLAEEGGDDEITVDYGMTKSGTVAFKTRGGRTSCPYEGAVYSKYYEPGNHLLSEGTVQIEKPVNDVSGPDQVLKVPSNKTATFKLDLKNESESGADVWFQIIIDESTNPNGAELKIDGGIIGNGRMFLVPAGGILSKTLTVGRGTVDKYERIGIVLRSECQSDIADTTYISVEFVPACTDVNIKSPANNWIINTNTSDTMNIVIDGFDRSFPNFGYVKIEQRPAGSPDWLTIIQTAVFSIRLRTAQRFFSTPPNRTLPINGQ
jgi:hypothetical protein